MERVELFFKKIEENTKELKKEIRSKLGELKSNKSEASFNIAVNKIDNFCKNIEECIKNNKKILLYGDYDVDGIFSTSMLLLTIKNYSLTMLKNNEIDLTTFKKLMTENLDFHIPSRDDGYGINPKIFNLFSKKYDYIITLDNGTQENMIECIRDKENKNKIFVFDHHFNGDFRKDDNVVNPNFDGSVEISTGILVYRFIEKVNKRKNFNLDTFPDLATFTFVSDVANLNSHRDILEKGLARINNAEFIAEKDVEKMYKLKEEVLKLAENDEQSKAIRKVEEIQKIKSKVFELEQLSLNRRKFITKLIQTSTNDDFTTVKNLQFNIIPKLNAVNRMTNDSSFLVNAIINNSKDESFYNDIIYNLNYINNNRKKLTKTITDEAISYVNKNNLQNNSFIFIQIDKYLGGLCGLVAQKIHDLTNADVVVASMNTKGVICFSGRGLNIYNQLDILSRNTNDYQKIFNFGGHLVALGGSINDLEAFKNIIEKTQLENKFLPKIENKIDLLKQESVVFDKVITLDKYEELSKYLSEKTESVPYNKKFLTNVIITSDMIDNKESVLAKIPNSEFVSLKLKMDSIDKNKERVELQMILNSRDAKHLIDESIKYERIALAPTFLLELSNNYIQNENNVFGGIVIFNNAIDLNKVIDEKIPNIKNKEKYKM